MLRYEDECRSCAVPGYPCIGSNCSYKNVPQYYCDNHNSENAFYKIEDGDYCEDCVKDYLQEAFNELTIFEKAELLKITLKKIE